MCRASGRTAAGRYRLRAIGVAAAERDHAGSVAAAQRALHHLSRAAHRSLGRCRRRTGRLRIRVDEHHHVGGPVGQPLGDVQAAAARADRPVDRAQLVAGDVGPNVGVLDAGTDVAGEVGAQPVEQVGLAGSPWIAVGPRGTRTLRRRRRCRCPPAAHPTEHAHPGPDRVAAPALRRTATVCAGRDRSRPRRVPSLAPEPRSSDRDVAPSSQSPTHSPASARASKHRCRPGSACR